MIELFLLAAVAQAAAHPVGAWLTDEEKARVVIERCGADLCGTIVALTEPYTDEGEIKRDINNPDPAFHERTVVGIEILRIGASPDKKGVWRDGSIYDPENGKTYKCKMWLVDANTLKLRGFVGISLLGRTVEWKRAETAPAQPE